MNTERMFKIIVLELSSDKLKIEQELERIINSDMEISIKTKKIKYLLAKLVTAEASISKFTSMLQNNENNEEKKQN